MGGVAGWFPKRLDPGYLLTQNYKEGSRVAKGNVLFTIDPRPFEAALAKAKADYANAVAKYQLDEITLKRQTELYERQVISEQEYQTSYQNAAASRASASAAEAAVQAAQVNLDYCTIEAPFDGIAGVAKAQIGDLVGPGGKTSELTGVSQIDPMKINFFITESEYLLGADTLRELQDRKEAVKDGKLVLTLADGETYPEKGWFDFVNREINSSTGTIQVTGLFPNPDGLLRPGLFAVVTAPVVHLPDALLVPKKATAEMQGNWFVGLLQEDNTVKAVPVQLGPTEGDMQVVEGPLKVGDVVVVEGIEKIRPGLKVDPAPWNPAGSQPAATPQPAAGKQASAD
jgi:RND family efflux transporter MFP subunit